MTAAAKVAAKVRKKRGAPAVGLALSKQDVAKVAAEAGVDPRTVERALCGSRQSKVVREAICTALRSFSFSAEAVAIERAVR